MFLLGDGAPDDVEEICIAWVYVIFTGSLALLLWVTIKHYEALLAIIKTTPLGTTKRERERERERLFIYEVSLSIIKGGWAL